MTRIALGLAVAALCWWMAFKGTPDLEPVEHRTQYRTAIMICYFQTLLWGLRMLGLA